MCCLRAQKWPVLPLSTLTQIQPTPYEPILARVTLRIAALTSIPSRHRPHTHPSASPPSHTSHPVPALTPIPSRHRPHTHTIASPPSYPIASPPSHLSHHATSLTPIPSRHRPHANAPLDSCACGEWIPVLYCQPRHQNRVCVYKRRTRIKTSLNLTSTAKTHNEFAYAVMHIKHPIHSACEVALNTTLLTGYPRPSPQSGTIRTKTPSEYSSRRFGRKC